MGLTKAGALKIAAKKHGMTVDELLAKWESGLRWCYICKSWRSAEEFHRDASRWDGLAKKCVSCACPRSNDQPGKRERRQKQRVGLAWCSGCNTWLPSSEVSQGKCRAHRNASARRHYAENEDFRLRRRARTAIRKATVEPVPEIGREILTEEFGGLCAYCMAPATTFDHIVPVSRGGKTVKSNVVPCCVSCNSSKKDLDLDEWVVSTGKPLHPYFDSILALADCALADC